jgi:RecA-family ATPase
MKKGWFLLTKRIEIEFKSSVEIMNTPMKKRRFIVDEMIYPGLHVLSGDPKIGKSWMMMDMCLAIAKGEKFLGRKTEQGHVVYMALEDTSDNLQTRMYELTDEPTDNLQYVLLVNTLGNGLEDDLRKCKETFSDLKLIVIDTLQKVRETVDMKYGSDYKDVSTLKSIADELGIAIILVHHNRKQQDSNPNNMILGTNGIPGASDGCLVLQRNGDSKNAILNIRLKPILCNTHKKITK